MRRLWFKLQPPRSDGAKEKCPNFRHFQYDLRIRNAEQYLTKIRHSTYVLNEPKILTFVITRNPDFAKSKIQEMLGDGNARSLGLVFGRFDLVFQIESESVEIGFEVLNKIRMSFLQTPKSQFSETSLLSLLCFPVRRTVKGRRNGRTDFRYGAYCVFRVVRQRRNVGALGDATAKVLDVLESVKKKCTCIDAELLWNPSLLSYVLILKGNNFDKITESLTILRRKALPIRDFCTFVAVSESCAEQYSEPTRVMASVNVKLGDSRLLLQMLKLPNSYYRLGYFDITRDIAADSLEALLREINKMRKSFKEHGPPNWTGTVLKFDPSRLLGETA